MRWHSRGGRSLFLANSESPSFVTGPSATKVSHTPGRLAGHAGRHESRPAPSRRETVPGSARSLRGPAALLAHLVAGVSRRIAGVLRLIVRGVERLGAHITCVVRRLGALVALRLGIVLTLLLCRSAGRSARGQVTGERCVAREPRHPLVQLALRAADRLLQVCLPLAHVAGHVALPLAERLALRSRHIDACGQRSCSGHDGEHQYCSPCFHRASLAVFRLEKPSKPRAPDSLFDGPHVAEPRRRPGRERHAVLMVGGASRPPSGFRLLAPYLWSAALSIGQRLVACKASTRCDALDGAPAGFAAVDARSPASRVSELRRSLLEERRHALPEVRRARGEHLVAVLQR